MEINGMAHAIVTVTNFARSRHFYGELLPFLGLQAVRDDDDIYYCVGGRTAFRIKPCGPQFKSDRFQQSRAGLHHLCFRARCREDVDTLHRKLVDLHAPIIRAPREDSWAPGYYSVFFEDPDGIRLEMNFVPGKGLLADSESRKGVA